MKKTTLHLLTVVLFLVPAVSIADDFPQRKAGLWEVTTSAAGMPGGQVVKQCIDATTDAAMMQVGKSMGGQMGMSCAKNEVKKEGGSFVAESDCNMAGTRMISKTVFSGDFNSAYSAESTARYEPAMMGMSESKTKISARWLGPCEANQQPGDMIMPNGMKMNFKDMAKLGSQMP